MKKKIPLFLVIIFCFAIPITAYAHFLGYSSVDEREIRWGGSTKYTAAQSHSITTWNALGKVNIAPDTIYTYEDVTYGDINRSDVTWSGLYTCWGALTDNIDFNDYYMSNYTDDEKKHVALHELGHALGLDHSYSPNVMVSGRYSITTLGSHDTEDYYSLWP